MMPADYAGLSYAVFPCKANKQPYTSHGLSDATTDAGTITAWWQRWPGANIGLLPSESVLVLDCDTAEAADQLERNYDLSACPKCRTPRRGAHFYLRLPEGAPPISTRTKALADIDIRGMGRAYVLAPPSRTEAGCYTWERPLVSPENLPEVPEKLLERLTPEKRRTEKPFKVPRNILEIKSHTSAYAQAALQAEHDAVAGALEGTRNDSLNRAAFSLGQLVGTGALDRSKVEEALMAAAMTCGLPGTEAERTIRSGLEAGVQEPRDSTNVSRFDENPCSLNKNPWVSQKHDLTNSYTKHIGDEARKWRASSPWAVDRARK